MNGVRLIVALVGLVLAGCSTLPLKDGPAAQSTHDALPVVVYVVKRSWHTDIGFASADLSPPLADLRLRLPDAHYLLFGFGDRHYLMHRGSGMGKLSGAIWPGAGLVLLTGLKGTPEQAFGAPGVTRLRLTADQAHRLEAFVWNTLAVTNNSAQEVAPGPYEDSFYYAATMRYSGLHTCNTWTAEALETSGLPVHSVGVELSGQLWRQVLEIAREQKANIQSESNHEAPNSSASPR